MIDAEDAFRDILGIEQTSRLTRKEAGSGMTEGPIAGEAMNVRCAYTTANAIDLRFVPGNWKGDRRVLQGAEIESVPGVLPEVIGINQNILANRLLKSRVVLISNSRTDWCGLSLRPAPPRPAR